MGRNLGSAFRKELANLDKDADAHKTSMRNLKSIVKDLDAKVIPVFVAQLSETKEIGSESGGYTVSLFEDLARAHGVKIAPHVEIIMPVIIRTLSTSEGSSSVQQACSKAVAAMARYGIDPATPEDNKRNVIHSICKPLSESLLDSQHQQHLALGSALCLKSLVDCDNWRFASDEMVNKVCQSLAVALEATSSEAKSHMALVIALAKHNSFIVEAYARLLVKSGLRILDLGVVEEDSQKRGLAIQMLNFLMKHLDPKSMCSEVELIFQEMEKHQKDQTYFVKVAAYETMRTAERLIREADPMFDAENCKNQNSLSGSIKSTPSLRTHHDPWSVNSRDDEGYVNNEEDDDVLFSGVASGRTGVSGSPLVNFGDYNQETGCVVESPRFGNQIQYSGGEDSNIESVWFHQRNRSSEFNESLCSRTNCTRSSRRNTKKKQSGDISSNHHRHGFTQDPFNELLENRQQCSVSSSSSSIYDTSGTTTPTNTTEDICEKPKSELDSEAELKTGETEVDPRMGRRSNRVLKLGVSFFSVAVAGFASFMWMHLQDDMLPPHLVPT